MKNEDLQKQNENNSILEGINLLFKSEKLHYNLVKKSFHCKKNKNYNKIFKNYSCVPLTTQALTEKGWKYYQELSIGDKILTYNIENDILEWNTIDAIHYYEDATLMKIQIPEKNIEVECTADHKWVLKYPFNGYPDSLIPTNQISSFQSIKTHSKINESFNNDIIYNEKDNLIENLLQMDFLGVTNFLMKNVKFFTHKDPKHLQGRFIFKYNSNEQEKYDAIEIAATLLGYRVYVSDKLDNDGNFVCSFTRADAESTRNLSVIDTKTENVWCPETLNHTWIMKQNDIITITGNSTFTNIDLVKKDKMKVETWKKIDTNINLEYQGK